MSAAALRLGVSDARIRQRLADPADELAGAPPRSAHNPRAGWAVDVDVLDRLLVSSTADAAPRSPAPEAPPDPVDLGERRIEDLLAEVSRRLGGLADLDGGARVELLVARSRIAELERELAAARDDLLDALDANEALTGAVNASTSRRRNRLLSDSLRRDAPPA